MHAPFEDSRPTKHHPNGGSNWNFDNDVVQSQLLAWQRTGNPRALQSVFEGSRAHVLRLVRGFHEVPLDETINEVLIKVWSSAHLYDPQRGTAFSFISRVATTVACNAQGKHRAWRSRHWEADADFWDHIEAPAQDLHGLEHFRHQIISGIKTRRKSGCERAAQRWIIESGFDADFHLRRHQIADSCMLVFGLFHQQARQLFDETHLEIRRVFLNEHRIKSVTPQELVRTRERHLIKYGRYLEPAEFSKLYALLRWLAPCLIILAKPENAGAIARGEADATRENLHLILDGDPEAKPLFPERSLSTAIG